MHLAYDSRAILRVLGLAAIAILFMQPGAARADAPTALMSGPNAGSADSFQGPHDWYVQAKKGSFSVQITSMGDGKDTVPLDSAFSYKIYFYPHIASHAYRYSQSADGFSFSGTLATDTKIVVRIFPAHSTLVRVARNYTIEATGNAIAFETSRVDPIVGTYVDKSHGHGAAHFNADGTIVFADGTQGAWVLFDRSLRIYTITTGSDRASVKFVPGRGLIDQAGNGNAIYDTAR